MAFTGNFVCSSFKQELLGGIHNFTTSTGHTFKLALYNNTAAFTAATTVYTATNEMPASGGYSAGGATLVIPASMPSLTGTVAWTDFDDYAWSASAISGAYGAMIYNSSASNKAIVILDFGGSKSSLDGDFIVHMPAADATTAIIRIF